MLYFFFKQKTADELRISDWSSDVCSSDLVADASLSYALPVSDRMTVIPTIGTSWANGKHMNRYFGIDASEAIASGLPFYRAESGFKDVSGLITAKIGSASCRERVCQSV